MADGDDSDRFVIELPPDADLSLGWAVARKLVQRFELKQCQLTAKGLSLEHAATLARKHAVELETRGEVAIPLELPAPIRRGEVRSATVFLQEAGYFGNLSVARGHEVLHLSCSATKDRADTERFYGSHVALLCELDVLTQPAPSISDALVITTLLRPGSFSKVLAHPSLFAGFKRTKFVVRSLASSALESIEAFRTMRFEPEAVSLWIGRDDQAALESVFDTLGGEFEATWEDGEEIRLPKPNEYTTIKVQALKLACHWRRPSLVVETRSWRGRGRVSQFLAEVTGCSVTEQEP